MSLFSVEREIARFDKAKDPDGSLELGSTALKPLWQSFDEIAQRHTERIAISMGAERLTYGELNRRSAGLTNKLRAMGVGPEVMVGVYLERSIESIVALIAILKAGGAYLPLDPAYPMERVEIILEDARPRVILSQEKLLHRLSVHEEAEVICLDAEDTWGDASDTEISDPGSTLESLAYVIYTSGSTGKPKGVMVTHGNVARLLTQTDAWFHFSEQDVWTVFHSLAFDFSVWEIWGCLLYGGRLVVVPFEVSRSPEDFYELLEREQVTVLNQTPSAFYQLINVDKVRRSPKLVLRVVVFGGEALNFRSLRPWFEIHGDRRPRLVNMYGITETTVHVTYREITADEAAEGVPSLIGVPIPDLQLHLLGENGAPVAIGEVGEICVGGAGVARGYLNRAELSAQRFVPDSFSDIPGAKLYRSGDLARYLPNGELEYLGRGDNQVKIQGFRIELGDIEAALVEHSAVREARVTTHTDTDGTKRLVAYFVAEGDVTVPAQEMSRFLSEKLPPWMMPSVYIAITAFPLTAHGKVDYAALPTPILGSVRDVKEVPASDWQQQVAEVWKQVLRAEHVGLDDNFFDIGGTSLLLVSVHSRLQVLLDRKIPIADLFAYTTVRTLSERLGGTASAGSSGNVAAQSLAQKQRAAFAKARAAKKATA